MNSAGKEKYVSILIMTRVAATELGIMFTAVNSFLKSSFIILKCSENVREMKFDKLF